MRFEPAGAAGVPEPGQAIGIVTWYLPDPR